MKTKFLTCLFVFLSTGTFFGHKIQNLLRVRSHGTFLLKIWIALLIFIKNVLEAVKSPTYKKEGTWISLGDGELHLPTIKEPVTINKVVQRLKSPILKF
jgi:hypothetical protein